MRVKAKRSDAEVDEYLQVQVPARTKHDLAKKAAETREPIRVVVLRALKAYGIPVPAHVLSDRRKGRSK